MLIKLEINRKSIEKNLKKIKKINKNIICILKDDAYGLGIENILPILIENGNFHFAAAYMEEALKIREIVRRRYKSELDNVNIMILNYIEDEDLKKALENNIEITLFSMEQFEKYYPVLKSYREDNTNDSKNIIGLRGASENRVSGIGIHIKVNTGMNRLGFDENEIEILAEKLKKLKKENNRIKIKSVYSHISDSEDKYKTELQIEKYENILTKLKENELEYGKKKIKKHIQASPLLFKYSEKYNYDFARIGMAIYGMEPLSERAGLENVVRLTSKIISIRDVKKGESVSYGKNSTVEKDTKTAVIPIGYAHGLKKNLEKGNAYVLIKGEKARIIGEVCMDMIIVDISNISYKKEVKVDDEAVIIGKQGNFEITVLDMANWAGTIQDDILTGWNKSIKRVVK